MEYRITLDFLPEDFGLYEYAKMTDKEKLAVSARVKDPAVSLILRCLKRSL